MTETEVKHLDNGQVVLKVTSKLGSAIHRHTATFGSVDGKDALSLPDDQLQVALQQHLDKVRSDAVTILSNRARVSAITKNLS